MTESRTIRTQLYNDGRDDVGITVRLKDGDTPLTPTQIESIGQMVVMMCHQLNQAMPSHDQEQPRA